VHVVRKREERVTGTSHAIQLRRPFRLLFRTERLDRTLEHALPLGFFTALQYLPADEQVNRIRLLSALDTLFERQREDARVVPQPPDIGLAACKARAMNAGLLPSAEADECAVFGVRDAVRLCIFECKCRKYEIRECVRGKLGGVSAGRTIRVRRTSALLVTMLLKRAASIFALFLRCWRCTPYTCLVSISPGVYAGSI
jgi:hypothetical protein